MSTSSRTLSSAQLFASVLLGVLGCSALWVAWHASTTSQETCRSDRVLGTFVEVPGGGFVMGASPLYPEEGAAERVYVSGFSLQAHEVTNAQFAAFVEETGHVTEAERRGGSARFVASDRPASSWHLDAGATWRTPQGAGSDLQGKEHHPVVHVSLHDARRYAAWAGGRLPYEVEWEYAASLGLVEVDQPTSGAFGPDGELRANIWTGSFPETNTAADGFVSTAPVACFPADRLGTYDMIGNVWEWTETPFMHDPARFTIKGGSHLCALNHCQRYRPSARQGFEPDFSSGHIGFRIVRTTPSHQQARSHLERDLVGPLAGQAFARTRRLASP